MKIRPGTLPADAVMISPRRWVVDMTVSFRPGPAGQPPKSASQQPRRTAARQAHASTRPACPTRPPWSTKNSTRRSARPQPEHLALGHADAKQPNCRGPRRIRPHLPADLLRALRADSPAPSRRYLPKAPRWDQFSRRSWTLETVKRQPKPDVFVD